MLSQLFASTDIKVHGAKLPWIPWIPQLLTQIINFNIFFSSNHTNLATFWVNSDRCLSWSWPTLTPSHGQATPARAAKARAGAVTRQPTQPWHRWRPCCEHLGWKPRWPKQLGKLWENDCKVPRLVFFETCNKRHCFERNGLKWLQSLFHTVDNQQ